MFAARRSTRSYGGRTTKRYRTALLAAWLLVGTGGVVQARTIELVALGDSLMAGYNLPAAAAYPAQLEAALRKNGFDVAVANASVSGDTTAGGLERLDWSVPDGTDGVLLELGANDMLRGQDPSVTRQNLATMVDRLKARHIAIYLLGMKADPTLGPDYVARFDAMYPDLARVADVPLYPFVLDGVAGMAKLQLADGMHPTAEGVAVMVDRALPGIAAWVKRLPRAP